MPVILSVCHLPEHFGRKKMHVLGNTPFFPRGVAFMRTRQSADSATSSINLGDAIKSFYHKTGLYYDAASLWHTLRMMCFYTSGWL
jgi:hypothetical protein